MALDPAFGAEKIFEALQEAAALNPDGTPKKDANGKPEKGKPDAYPPGFSNGYNDYAMQGEVPGTINEGGDTSPIETFLSGGGGDLTDFATAIANFWATVALTPGDPISELVVVSVVNDATAHIADFEAAIEASMTDVEKKPYFKHFVENLEGVVKSIIWTVTEQDADGASVVHLVGIS